METHFWLLLSDPPPSHYSLSSLNNQVTDWGSHADHAIFNCIKWRKQLMMWYVATFWGHGARPYWAKLQWIPSRIHNDINNLPNIGYIQCPGPKCISIISPVRHRKIQKHRMLVPGTTTIDLGLRIWINQSCRDVKSALKPPDGQSVRGSSWLRRIYAKSDQYWPKWTASCSLLIGCPTPNHLLPRLSRTIYS